MSFSCIGDSVALAGNLVECFGNLVDQMFNVSVPVYGKIKVFFHICF